MFEKLILSTYENEGASQFPLKKNPLRASACVFKARALASAFSATQMEKREDAHHRTPHMGFSTCD